MFSSRASSLFLLTCLGLGTAAGTAQADFNYDVAEDFSATSNPTGVWSYGWSQSLGSTFTLSTIRESESNLDFWEGGVATGAPPGSFPHVFHNGTNATITYANSAVLAPGQLGFHPGPDGQFSVVRFTAPTTTTYVLNSLFTGIDTTGTTSDVHVLLNGTALFDGVINSFGASQGYAASSTLNAGDVLDFAVGYGSNRSYAFDGTGLSATLSSVPVPEPSAGALTALGVLGLGGAVRVYAAGLQDARCGYL